MVFDPRSSRAANLANRFAATPARLAGITLFFLMSLTFVDVIARSVFSAPLSYSAELTEMAMAVIVFAALPMATLQDGHIVVDLLDKYFPARAAFIRDMATDVICGAALLFPAVRVWTLGIRSKSYGEVTEILGLPQFYLIWFVSAALFACCAVYFLRIGLRLSGGGKGQGAC